MKYVIGTKTHLTKTAEVSAALDEAQVAVGPIDGETVFIFGSDHDFQAWARDAPPLIHDAVKKTEELARKARELEHADNTAAMMAQELASSRTLADLDGLAARFGLDPASPELIRLAHEGISVLEPPVLHSAILWDGFACSSGASRVIPALVPHPTLGNLNNAASSVTGAGSLTLWENNWFGGRQRTLFLLASCIHLSDINWDNIASSAIAV
jgi:hypothetical protein